MAKEDGNIAKAEEDGDRSMSSRQLPLASFVSKPGTTHRGQEVVTCRRLCFVVGILVTFLGLAESNLIRSGNNQEDPFKPGMNKEENTRLHAKPLEGVNRRYTGAEKVPRVAQKEVRRETEDLSVDSNTKSISFTPTSMEKNEILGTEQRQLRISSEKEIHHDVPGFSACLLIRDENHQLIEWLAYHYLYLPLRHLVIAVDDTSLTSPEEIVNRWKGRMDITVWKDKDFYDGPSLSGTPLLEQKQMRFYMHCAKLHKAQNRTWVMMTDVDEFVSYNTVAKDEPGTSKTDIMLFRANKMFPKTGQKYNPARDLSPDVLKSKHPNLWEERENKLKARKKQLQRYTLSNPRNTMIELINTAPWNEDVCLVIPRLLFTSKPKRKNRIYKKLGIAKDELEFDPTNVRTVNYFRHDGKEAKWWGKVMIDVSRSSYGDLNTLPEQVHSPFPPCGWPVPKYEESPLRIHHYLGSWEEFSYKRDCRKTRKRFNERSKLNKGEITSMLPWLKKFVDVVGISKANLLLKGVGVLEPLPIDSTNSDGCITTELGNLKQ